jgi:hypothetical protein
MAGAGAETLPTLQAAIGDAMRSLAPRLPTARSGPRVQPETRTLANLTAKINISATSSTVQIYNLTTFPQKAQKSRFRSAEFKYIVHIKRHIVSQGIAKRTPI